MYDVFISKHVLCVYVDFPTLYETTDLLLGKLNLLTFIIKSYLFHFISALFCCGFWLLYFLDFSFTCSFLNEEYILFD